ncbi:hypothetical protein Tco_0527728 [Tanacetum coccineum]
MQRLNHQNKFIPIALLTTTSRIPVNTVSHNFNSQAVSTSAARKVNVVRPIVNENRLINNFYKSHSPIRRPFNRTTAPRTNFSNHKVNTAGVKAVSAIRGIREPAVKPSAELQHFNLFSVSQMCDKKNKVLFTDTECLVLSSNFKLPDENQVLLRIPRQNNMYSFNIENIVPSGGLACLIAKATIDESNKWHRRLGHPVRSENQVNKTAGPEKTKHRAVKSSEAKNEDEKPNKNTSLKTNKEPVDQEDQAFLEELKRLKRQEKEANEQADSP